MYVYIYANMYMGNMDDPPDAQMGSKNLHEMANIRRKPLRLMVHRSKKILHMLDFQGLAPERMPHLPTIQFRFEF